MTSETLQEQLVKYLTDAHSIEQQALAQMEMAPKLAGDPELASQFERHLEETREHDRLVSQQLEAHGAEPSRLKDLAGRVSGKGFGLFAQANPDTPGKLVAHAYSYEHMEEAAYDLLAAVAERAADARTAAVAREIGGQERAMAARLADDFGRAVDAALRDLSPDDLGEQLDKYLEDAHAIEGQSTALLERGQSMAGDEGLARALQDHLEETREHQRLLEERLQARGASPSRLKDAALRLGAMNWGMFFAAQPDTPAKLAGFAYAVEHLEVAAYELLRRVAARAGDEETRAVAERILAEEHAAAERVHACFDDALDVTLADRGLAPG
jgi:ferritin-like metal-binding protein YciE